MNSVVGVSIVRAAFVKDFYDPDFTWALPRIYVCTIIERNLSQFIADLPAIYPVFRTVYEKVAGSIRYGSNRSKTHSGVDGNGLDVRNDSQQAIVTIGSAETRPIKLNDFSPYGKSSQLSQLSHVERGGSDEYI